MNSELTEAGREQVPHNAALQEKICPFMSKPDMEVLCKRERCAVWVITECAFLRQVKVRTGL